MGRIGIALVPFWRLDAKGGEVVLLGSPGDLHGKDISILNFLFASYMLMSMYLKNFCICVCCKLCSYV